MNNKGQKWWQKHVMISRLLHVLVPGLGKLGKHHFRDKKYWILSFRYKTASLLLSFWLTLLLSLIPTYYWPSTPPHFFRSHRSSTLDFHFLSHYSYIKAIMLYKGNHWTWYAGFMGATLVWLGNTNGDLGTSWALPGDNLGMTWGWLGHYFGKTWQDSGILWHTLAYSAIFWTRTFSSHTI